MPVTKDIERYTRILRSGDCFEGYDQAELVELVEACEAKILMTGEALWAIGSVGDAAYILIDGRVECTQRLQPVGQRTEQINEPGSMMSLSSLVHPWKHQSAAYPLERTEVLKLSRASFERMFEGARPVTYRLIDSIAENLVLEMRDANRRLHEVFGHPAETLRTLRRRSRKG